MRENKNIGSELDATALRIRGGGRRLVAAVIIDIIAALAVIVFGVLLWSSGLLPLKFFIPLCVILLLLCGVLTILSLGGRHLLRPTLGMIFNLLLALACVLGSYMVTKGVDTLRDIIGKRESSNHVGIYVRTDDPAKDLQDLESYAFGILGDEDRENTDEAIAELEKTLGDGKKISYTEYKNKFSMVSDLLSGKLGAVFLNSSYIDVISDVEGFENLGSKLREVYSVRVVSDKTDNKTDIKQPSDTGYPDGVFTVYMSGIDTRSGYLVEKSRCDSNILDTGTCAYQHGITVSMIAACKFDDLIFPRITSCNTDCTHNSFCTRIDHSDHIHMRDSVTDKFSHFHFDLCSASKAQTFFTGLQNTFPYCRKIVSQDHWSPGIYVINIAVAIYIINIAAICTFNKSRCFSNSAICTHRTVYTARDSFYRSLKKLLRLCHYPILPSSIIFAISSAK